VHVYASKKSVQLTKVNKRQSSSVDGIFGRVGILGDNRSTVPFVVSSDGSLNFLPAQVDGLSKSIGPLAQTLSWVLADMLGGISV